MQGRLHAKQSELVPLSSARDSAAAARDIKQSELDLLTKGSRDIEAQQEEASASLQQAKQDVKERKRELSALSKRRDELRTAVPRLEKKSGKLQQEQGPLDEAVSAQRVKLEEKREASKQTTTQNRVLEALKEQARRGRVHGFHGRLGSLGAIDDKYDVAVTTACGALNHLVVETVEQGQWCVEFLRKHKVGRATFIILEKIQHVAERAARRFDGPVPRLYDLVRVKVGLCGGGGGARGVCCLLWVLGGGKC